MKRRTPLEQFVMDNRDWDEKDIQLAIAYYTKLSANASKATKTSVSFIAWVIGISAFIGLVLGFFTGLLASV